MTETMIEELRAKRKLKTGTVVSAKMNKTVVVKTESSIRHPRYGKIISRAKKYYAHNEIDGIVEGDLVVIMETRPLSKLKCWRVVEKIGHETKAHVER